MDRIKRREFIGRSILLGGSALFGVPFLNSLYGRPKLPVQMWFMPIQPDNPSIYRWKNKCKGCRECLTTCQEDQMVYGTYEAGNTKHVCIHCGSCIKSCTYDALTEKYNWEEVLAAIDDPSRIVIASISPAVRVGIGDYFGMPEGAFMQENLVGACRDIGFDYVLDTNFSADLTVMEEAKELEHRITAGSDLPQFTSCCPAWVKYVEIYYPSLINHLSTTRSPIGMQGAMVKSYFAGNMGIDPAKIVHVAIAPCTAKKYEITREELTVDGMRSSDFSLTTNELAIMFNERQINFAECKGTFDPMMGAASGGGIIFANTGGVTRAALRTAYYNITKKTPPAGLLEMNEVQGLTGLKEAKVQIGKATLNVAVCYEMKNAKILLDQVTNGTCKYDFIEVMACKGGCVGGAGQPADDAVIEKRIKALNAADAGSALRYSYKNPEIKEIYKKFLGKEGSEKAHHYLHTTYNDKSDLLMASGDDTVPADSFNLIESLKG